MKNLFARFVRDEEGQDLIEHSCPWRRSSPSARFWPWRCRPTSTPSSARSARSSNAIRNTLEDERRGATAPADRRFQVSEWLANMRQSRLRREETGMESVFHRLIREQQGQDLIEYALPSSFPRGRCITGILELTRIVEFFEAVGVILRTDLSAGGERRGRVRARSVRGSHVSHIHPGRVGSGHRRIRAARSADRYCRDPDGQQLAASVGAYEPLTPAFKGCRAARRIPAARVLRNFATIGNATPRRATRSQRERQHIFSDAHDRSPDCRRRARPARSRWRHPDAADPERPDLSAALLALLVHGVTGGWSGVVGVVGGWLLEQPCSS